MGLLPMPKFALSCAGLSALVCWLAGCHTEAKLKIERGGPDLPTVQADPAAAGTIRGSVRFKGRLPVTPTIDFSSNPQCEREHPKPVKEETVVLNPNHTLRDTFVWIKSGLPRAQWPVPTTPVKLDQVGCLYEPHVLALRVGQELAIANSDPVNHDVHVESAINPTTNESEPPRSETLHKRYSAQEIWFPITCSVHPWMRSYVSVVSHPYFAVTGTDGSFELKSVPPGSYVIEAIQEKFGRQEQHVTVTAQSTTASDFTYAP